MVNLIRNCFLCRVNVHMGLLKLWVVSHNYSALAAMTDMLSLVHGTVRRIHVNPPPNSGSSHHVHLPDTVKRLCEGELVFSLVRYRRVKTTFRQREILKMWFCFSSAEFEEGKLKASVFILV